MDIIQEIREKIHPGTVIPKPQSKADFKVKGWGNRRGEHALIYLIPNHNNQLKPYQKGVNISEWEKVYTYIIGGGSLDHVWFRSNLPGCAKEGSCNFTTIGGIFLLLGLVYYERGKYSSVNNLRYTL